MSSILVRMSRRDIMVKKRLSKERQEGESPLRKLRDEFEMSQEDFGRSIGVTARTVSRWESGDSDPTFTVPQIKALATLLESKGKSIHDLPDVFGPVKQQEVSGNN